MSLLTDKIVQPLAQGVFAKRNMKKGKNEEQSKEKTKEEFILSKEEFILSLVKKRKLEEGWLKAEGYLNISMNLCDKDYT